MCDCIREMEAGLIENCGVFSRVAPPGFVCLCWPFENIVTRMSLKIEHMEVSCDTKTKDNVFVKAVVAVQYQVIPELVESAYYKLTNPRTQIQQYVFDQVRSEIPKSTIDEAYESKDGVAHAIKHYLDAQMEQFGYKIIACLVLDIDPDKRVKASMNEINASVRIREANSYRADADKILAVKGAEAEAEAKYLSGLGVAKQRKAIVDGLRDTVADFSSEVRGTTAKDVMDLLLITQYFDMIKDVGVKSLTANSVFLPHGPHAVSELRQQLASSFTDGKL